MIFTVRVKIKIKSRDIMMNSFFKHILIASICSNVLFLNACSHNNQSEDQAVIEEKYFISEAPYRMDQLDRAQAINVMKYNMKNVQGKTIEATALVFFPKTVQPKDGWRIVVWQHGAVGVADQCAPSETRLDKDFSRLATSLLAEGYVIVAPDYEGLGSFAVHPFLNLTSEVQSTLAAIKAVKQHYVHQLNGAWLTVGQSQGGQASLGTAEYANNNAFYKGAVAVAPASSFGQIILDIAPDQLRQLELEEIANGITDLTQRNSISTYATLLAYTALTGVGITAYEPYFQYRDLFQARAQPLAALAEGKNGLCLHNDDSEKSLVQNFEKDMIKFMHAHPEKSVMDYPGLNVEALKTNATVTQFWADNQPATKRLDKPVLVIQGGKDEQIPEQVTRALVDRLKQELKSPNVLYILVENADHNGAIVASKSALVNFIKKNMPAK